MKHTLRKLLALLIALMLLVPTFALAAEETVQPEVAQEEPAAQDGVTPEAEEDAPATADEVPNENPIDTPTEPTINTPSDTPTEPTTDIPDDEDTEAEVVSGSIDQPIDVVEFAYVEEDVQQVSSESMNGIVWDFGMDEGNVTNEAMNTIADTDVASIGDTGYATLAEAVAAASDGTVIKLEKDITLTDDKWYYISSGTFTLDGNNKTITVSNQNGLLLFNSVVLQNANIVMAGAPVGVYIYGNGNVNLENVNISSDNSSGSKSGVYIYGDGNVILNNVTVSMSYGKDTKELSRFGIMKFGSGTLKINSGAIDANKVVYIGGNDAKVDISDITINAWGAIQIYASNTVTNISGCNITSTNWKDGDASNIYPVFYFNGGDGQDNNTINVEETDITIRAEGTAHQTLVGSYASEETNVVNFKSGHVDFGNNTAFEYDSNLEISGGTFNKNPQETEGLKDDGSGNIVSEGNQNYVVEGFGGFELDEEGNYIVRKPIVKFDVDGGSPAPEEQKVNAGDAAIEPAKPAKSGYEFDGWYADEADTPFEFSTAIDADITLTARWKVNQYTLTFAETGDSKVDPITLNYGAKVTAPKDPTRTGYTFAGWSPKLPETMPAENMKVTATWKANQYTLTFAETGDSKVDPITLNYGAKVTAPAAPVWKGHTFIRWGNLPETMPAYDLTVSAIWDVNAYTLTFANTGDTVIAPMVKQFGEEITPPANPTRAGYTFAGWDVEIPKTMPAEDVTITAKWTANPDYTLFATVKASGKKALKLSWTGVAGAEGYDVFFGACGETGFELLTSVPGGARSYKIKGLKRYKGYKAYVRAWRTVGGEKACIGEASPTVHAITAGYTKRYTNPKKVTVKKSRVALAVGNTAKIKATVKKLKSTRRLLDHADKLRYYSSDPAVAVVGADGTIKAVGNGACTVYAVAVNGMRAAIKVTVK